MKIFYTALALFAVLAVTFIADDMASRVVDESSHPYPGSKIAEICKDPDIYEALQCELHRVPRPEPRP